MTWPMEVFDWWDAGHGVKLAFFASGTDNHFIGSGLAWAHPDGGDFCVSCLQFDIPNNAAWAAGPQWHIEQMNPVTLSPSILCTAHRQWHGYVRNGLWVPA